MRNRRMYAEMVRMTPEKAKDILDNRNNGIGNGNRPIRRRQVAQIVDAMVSGEWDPENGESLKFNKLNELVDGQHRLTALLQYGKALEMFCIFNVSDDAFTSIDSVTKRSGGDTLATYGIKAGNQIAAISTFMMCYGEYEGHSVEAETAPSNKAILAFTNSHPQIIASEKKCQIYRSQGSPIIALSIIAGIHCIATEAGNGEMADSFAEQVYTGIGIKKNSGTYLLRQIMLNNVMAKKKIRQREKIAYAIKAWNLHLEGSQRKILKNIKGQKMPTIITE